MLIVFLGDSITEGLGVSRSKTSYADLLKAKLEYSCNQSVDILNLGASAMQVNETRDKYEQMMIELQPDLIVYAHGITESIVREQKKALKYLPKRWRRPGWMDPRPYYSTRKSRRLLEVIESGLRWRVKVSLIKRFGGKQWMSLSEFKRHTAEFTATMLNDNPNTKLIFLLPGDIEEKYFPGSPESMRKYREVMRDVVELNKVSNRVFMCDASASLHRWNDYFYDRFHPNEQGHDKIAEALLNTINEYDLMRNYQGMREVSR